ncbi:hypothetical protein CHLRE_06g310350v5 [Chlamydomonas reinhardtii]|uniref:Uncharacterized protein n=1 Tax=Chlamydomonas reinhardtii TaxID=3055 RepID=A8IM97_CHLRE|nr:uncharacterized protein CHLRE_06g310350v5 [Chlamydomonas reinhardtii]PNW83187.1 hypothetical protein CHLRE_06g310350v5 [Chlamydomonas reinhardtii]|eukprot:XP_001691196.1 predicted protein [Chlamydomonas reinhardtii]
MRAGPARPAGVLKATGGDGPGKPAPAPLDSPTPGAAPPTTTSAGAPQTPATSSLTTTSPVSPAASSKTAAGSGEGQQPEQQPDPDAQVVAELGGVWENLKKEMRKDMTPEQAQVLDSIKVDDLLGDNNNLMQKVADDQLGPLLRSVGIEEDPLAFFTDLLRLGTALQLGSAAVLFYGAELAGGYDAGEAFRCVGGLALGYLSRPFFKVEQLLWPLYDAVLSFVAPGAVYEVAHSAEESAATLSRLGVAVAVASFAPQLLWGWNTEQTLQLVLPLACGWVLFDVAYMAALLIKLGSSDRQ